MKKFLAILLISFLAFNTFAASTPSTKNVNTIESQQAPTQALLAHIIHAWESGSIAEFTNVYANNATGRIDLNTQLNYQDIKNRFKYVAANNTQRHFDIKNILIQGNQAMIFFCYTAYDKRLKQKVIAPTMWLFTIKDNKIIHVEILTSLQLNYKAQA